MAYLLVVIVGTIIGSFLNVCIYRVPLKRSVVNPPSHCPFCGKLIKWYCNIPIISYLILKGKCGDCERPIPLRYLLVEFITALAGVILFYVFSFSPQFCFYWVFTWILIVLSGIDIEHHVIPDVITIPGIVLGVLFFVIFRIDGSASCSGALVNSLLGIATGCLSMVALGLLGEFVLRKESLGGGDVKLLAMAGAFLGWKLVLLVFVIAPIFAVFAASIMRIKYRKREVAYGPYLSLGAFVSAVCGSQIIDYVLRFSS